MFNSDNNNFFADLEFLKNIGLDLNQNARVLVLLFFIVIVLKNIFFFFYNYKLSNFLYIIKNRLTSTIYKQYIFQTYDFYFKKKSSEILRNVRLPNNFAQVISAQMNLILELLTILILVLFLIKINPIITIFILLIMSLAGYCVYVLWREKIYDWGKDAQYMRLI